MEVNREMERLHETVQQHSADITQLKLDALQRDHKIDLLTAKVEGMNLQFADLKATVSADGTKTREAMEKVTDKLDRHNDRLWRHIEKIEEGEQLESERANTLEMTKEQTRTQRWIEFLKGAFALFGSIVAAVIAYQEVIVGLFK